MDIYQQEKSERRTWRFAVLTTGSCAGILISLYLAGCQPKKQPVAIDSPTVILADTNRVKLKHQADASEHAVIILNEQTQTSVTTYEKAAKKYDSIRVALP